MSGCMYHLLSQRSGLRSTPGGCVKKGIPKAMTLALLMLASVMVVTSCTAPTGQKTTGMTLEDAPAVLDLSSVLPSGFVKLDDWQFLDQLKQALGLEAKLGADASEPQVFQSESPFQIVYCFLRIVEDATEQEVWASMWFDERLVRNQIKTFLNAIASGQGLGFVQPLITVSNPAIGIGAVLAWGEIEIQDNVVRLDMLCFRSEDKRVFGFVHSWYSSGEQESVLALGREIERRITDFGR